MADRKGRLLNLLDAIREAFHGVELGDGVSLHETIVIDDYGSPEARRVARAPDEKHDWQKLIGDPEFTRTDGLSFYDATGFRFHLPAYLMLAVTDFERKDADNVLGSLMFHLTHLSEYNRRRFSILSGTQRRCVRDVLHFLREVYALESAELDQAIDGYWNSDPEAGG